MDNQFMETLNRTSSILVMDVFIEHLGMMRVDNP